MNMKIGEMELFLVTDGISHVDAGGPFGLVPRPLYEKYFRPDQSNRVPMSLTSMIIRSQGKTILVDTGHGQKLTSKEIQHLGLVRPDGGLVAELEHIGISPAEIDIVINTHLHGDHCGGNTYLDGDHVRPTFPNATYLVQRMEWADFSHPDVRTRGTYLETNFTPLWNTDQVQLLHGDTDVTENVRCVITPGHTRGHQSVLLKEGEWRGIFLGDVASYSILMSRTSWLTAYDIDPLQNISTKEHWQNWALERDAWLFFQHDPYTPVAQLRSDNGRLNLVASIAVREISDSLPIPRPPHE
jgi:glyoxylase-like metal-dependent hydrolase (beta-lactamase superfamily II)